MPQVAKLLLSSEAYFDYLHGSLVHKPTKIVIVSHGFNAGIAYDGRDTNPGKSKARNLLEAVREVKDVQILIGLHPYQSCKGNNYCKDCERRYVLELIKYLEHQAKYPEYKWKVALETNLKCVLFIYTSGAASGVVGSRNFNDSEWPDVSTTLDQAAAISLGQHVQTIWTQAKDLIDNEVERIFKEQGISEGTISSIMSEV